jgi:nucleotidyltransferase substrate binding protein (TIGR01987 family)
MQAADISLLPLEKALASLERALLQPKDEFTRDSVVQRFEYSYELLWKTLKRVLLSVYRIEENAVKELFRQAAKMGLIDNVERWFVYHEARNLTSHTYQEDTAEKVYAIAPAFLQDSQKLFIALNKTLNDAA